MKIKKKLKKSFSVLLSTMMLLTLMVVPTYAADTLEVTHIVANSKVGANDREVYSFDVTVNDITLVQDLKAEDFDITNNIATTVLDVDTGTWCAPYENDEISLSIDGNTITLTCKQFKYDNTWEVVCTKYPELSFKKDDVDDLKTDILDDTTRGTYTYAGLTREYALYVPKDVEGPVPLVVWNHGGGEYNIDLETNLLKNRGLTAWPESGYKTAVLMIQVANPNYSYGTSESPERQMLIDQNNALQAALIKDLIKNGTVAENRVYITGASSGGGATMRFLMQYPELFAGAIACCSMDPIVTVHNQSFKVLGKEKDSFDTIVSNFENAFQGKVYTWDADQDKMVEKQVNTKSLINVPIYFTHAQNDPTCSVDSSKAMYQAFKNLGDTNNKITIWSNDDLKEEGLSDALFDATNPNSAYLLHWSWVKVFNHNEAGSPMNWLFKQSRTTSNDSYKAQLYARVTDAGQVVNKMVIDFGTNLRVSGIDKNTFTVHATSTIQAGAKKGQTYYDLDRKIVKIETKGNIVTIYFDESEGATLTWLGEGRNYPAQLNYTITQNKSIKVSGTDGTELADINSVYTCDNTVIDDETAKFKSVKVDKGIHYQFYNAGKDADSLIVWFHGNGEGDLDASGNNVAQMLANRGTVAWATDEAQKIFGEAHVMAFQAPSTWYYAQKDNLLAQVKEEIDAVVKEYGIDPSKIIVSGCSAGGYMTTRMLIAYPDLFAAAMINCPALDVAQLRDGETPTDAELAGLRDSDTAIWLVQGVTDSSVKSEDCSQRMFNILTEGQDLTKTTFNQKIASDFTTYETKDGKYKLSLYETVDLEDKADSFGNTRPMGKLQFAEDYDQDGTETLVKYSDHWSWIYTLNNNPQAADGSHIWQWAASKMGQSQSQKPENTNNETNKNNDTNKTSNVKTSDNNQLMVFGLLFVLAAGGFVALNKKHS